MKAAAFSLALLLLLFASCSRAAGDLPPDTASKPDPAESGWIVGDVYISAVVYCSTRDDAQDIARAYADGGEDAADVVLSKKKGLCTYHLAKFYVRKLVSEHNGARYSANVIEVEDFMGSGMFYMVSAGVVTKFKPTHKVKE